MRTAHVSADLAALVRAAQGGDRAALADLIAVVRPAVYRYVLSRVCDRAIADDVTQEVAMTVLTALPRYQDTGHSVLAWAIGIAANKVNESRRARRRHGEVPVEDVPEAAAHAEGPEAEYLSLEATREVAALLATLPAPQGDILRLRIAAGLSAEETAAVLGMSAGAVRVAQHRALGRLRAVVLRGVAS